MPLKTLWVGTPKVNDIVFTNGIDEEGFLCSSNFGNQVEFKSSNYNYFDIRLSNESGTQVLYQYQTYSTEGTLDYPGLSPGYYVFGVRGVNDCGTAEWTETEVEYIDCSQMRSPYYLEFTPNQVITETTVELKRNDKKEVSEDLEWEFEVYDMSQIKKLKTYKFHGRKRKIKTDGWKEGVYIVRAIVKEELVSGKFIKK